MHCLKWNVTIYKDENKRYSKSIVFHFSVANTDTTYYVYGWYENQRGLPVNTYAPRGRGVKPPIYFHIVSHDKGQRESR